MNLKKNAVSYVTWMIILLFTGATFSFLGMVAAHMLNINIVVAAAGCIVVFFGILFLVYSMTGYIASMHASENSVPIVIKNAPLVEKIVLILGIVIGIAIRVYFLPMAGEEAAYYEVSKVTDQSGILVQSVQGSVYYYCLLLHGLFWLVGNHWIAGIWMQIILQMCGALLLYVTIKKLTAVCPAFLVYFYILFAPSSLRMGLTYSPQILYFCIFSVALYFFADYISRSLKAEESPVVMWVYTIFVGLLIGVSAYIDVTGCLLLIPAIYLFMVKREASETKLWILRFLLILASALVAFLLMILVDGIISGSSFIRVLNAWFVTYGSVQVSFDIITNYSTIDFFVIILLICMGTLSFWRRKSEERFTPFVYLCLGIAVLHFCGITTENMNAGYLMYVLFSILAAISVTELFCTGAVVDVGEKKEELEVIDLEKPEEKLKKEEKEEKPRLIESPLPLPKKHVKKTMDYAVIPKERDMKYDLLVPDSDDYDI